MKLILRIVMTVLFLSLAQCGGGGDNDSDKVEIEFNPEKPIVIDADLTLNPGDDDERVVKAPWASFDLGFKNTSKKAVVIVTYTAEVTGFSKGKATTAKFKYDPGVTDDVVLTALPAQQTSITEISGFFADNLPKSDSFRYQMVFSFIGYFLDTNDDGELVPSSRFSKQVTIYTQ